jgi:4-hydroxybenzoyl-CoA thioesterase
MPSPTTPIGTCFEKHHRIRFGQCDPSGIIFFPQYFELFNSHVEDWFAEALGVPFAHLIGQRRLGLPTVHLETDFRAISRMGDEVLLVLHVAALGTRSLTLELACFGFPSTAGVDKELRVRSQHVLVTTNLETHGAVALPPDLRRSIERFAGLSTAPWQVPLVVGSQGAHAPLQSRS